MYIESRALDKVFNIIYISLLQLSINIFLCIIRTLQVQPLKLNEKIPSHISSESYQT